MSKARKIVEPLEDDTEEGFEYDPPEEPQSWSDLGKVAPLLNNWPKLRGDLMACCDLHVPFQDNDMLDDMCVRARSIGLKRLLIVGDFFDFGRFSSFHQLAENPSVNDELDEAYRVFRMLTKTFDSVLLTLGNHDIRFARKLDDQVKVQRLLMTCCGDMANRSVKVSKFPYSEITSGGKKWRFTHPKSYSRIAAKSAKNLIAKHLCNVAAGHCHFYGRTPDLSGTMIAVGMPAMVITEKVPYLMFSDTDHPVWANGYTTLINGSAKVYPMEAGQ